MKQVLLVVVLLAFLVPALSSSDSCSSQAVADSVHEKLQGSLANLTRNYAQVDELLAPLSTFLHAALMKQVLTEYHNSSCTGDTTSDMKKVLNKLDTVTAQVDQVNRTLTELIENTRNSNTNGYRPSPLLHSCEEIKRQWPDSSSDYYTIVDGSGRTRHVYCEMKQVCGSSGWMRVAYLNMTDPNEDCPSGFRLYQRRGVRACGRSGGGCQSVQFQTHNTEYTEVCGKVIGYQHGSPDAFHSNYVDGVSITRGYSRQHLWTYAAGLQENFIYGNGQNDCPCSTGSRQGVPSFVGGNYYCESGCSGHWDHTTFHTNDRLWDGQRCGTIERGCCRASRLPWFHRRLDSPTSDHIELRICGNQDTSDEDVPVELYQLYVK